MMAVLSRTRKASEGSVPAIAPARAEVSDSTSSIVAYIRERVYGRITLHHTNQHNDESILIFNHVCDGTEQSLDEFSRLREPSGE